jgi:hypothetical protein
MHRSTFSWVRFIPRPLYPQYPLVMRLDGPQNRSEKCGENSSPYQDSNSGPLVIQPEVSCYTDSSSTGTIQTDHFRVLYPQLSNIKSYWVGPRFGLTSREHKRAPEKSGFIYVSFGIYRSAPHHSEKLVSTWIYFQCSIPVTGYPDLSYNTVKPPLMHMCSYELRLARYGSLQNNSKRLLTC